MRKIIVCNIVSLDGYFTGPDNNVMVLPMDEAFDAYNAERLRAAGTLLLGGTTYDGLKSFWPNVADNSDLMSILPPARREIVLEISRLNNAIDKVVVSDSLNPDETDPWRQNTRIIRRAEAHQQVAELKQGDGKDILIFGSHILWNDLLAQGLLNELHLMIGPVVVREGTPAFEVQPPVSLQLIDARALAAGSENVLVRYEVAHTGA